MLKPRIRSLSVMVGLVIFSSVATSHFMVASRSFATESKDAKLRRLLRQRLDILKQIVSQIEELHKERVSGLKDLYAARVAMFRAQLELCTSDEERIDVLEQLLSQAKHRELAEWKSARAGAQGVEKMAATLPIEEAQVDRLNIEIELEHLKIK